MPRQDTIMTGQQVGLPPVVFFYTIDQIASMLNLENETVMQKYLYFMGRSTGQKKTIHMEAINIAPDDEVADWRISMKEFIQWLRRRGFKTYGLSYFH